MKRIALLLICTMLLCSCDNSTTPSSTSETEEITSSVSETTTEATAVTTTSETESTTTTTAAITTTALENKLEPPIQSEYIDENGYLTEEFSKRVQLFIDSYVDRTASGAILTLQDFDFDNVPEIVYTAHDGGQQEKESKVYRAEDFHYYGSFDGFCRDGYTKFFNKYDGVIIHNFCEHSNQLRNDRYTHAIIEDDKLITAEIGRYDAVVQNGRLNGEEKINDEFFAERDIINPKHVVNILEKEEYSVTINEMADSPNKIENIVELYNSYKRIENTYKEICAALDLSFSVDFLCMDDYDGDGKPEAFFQHEKLGFINSNCEVSYFENGFDFTEYCPTYFAYGVRRIWNDVIVFSGMGNCEPCLVLTVRNGKPEEVKEISMQGMMFNYSEYEVGQFTLCQSAYDAPYHTWKPYFFYRDSEGNFKEYGAIYADIDEFTRVTGVDPYKVIIDNYDDFAGYRENGIPDDKASPIRVDSILYRSNGYCHINWTHCKNEETYKNITIKCYGDGKYDVIYGDGGVYDTANCPDIAVYPEKLSCD
ncbi:MAG: hypothetical protein ACI4KA_04705 [Oscillospiraceae bacterium]